ncbi:hypothetical protein EW026_g2535 [Hermanssonia centrifuga]|uniref:Major facilitator superfamily (MFS) profile domain-containing protein n=1 Tax=Hermanssonia centrifuga TaxID=98765 RepID=A0A4S4KNZ1_9APHY|nr:hypothetical protein EW026_g2535 [Hermanssonia centrifuga]
MAASSTPPQIPMSKLEPAASPSRPSTAGSVPLSQTSSTVASTDDREPAPRDDNSAISEYEREAYGPQLGEKGWDEFEVRFAPGDPEDPHNWSRSRRWYITLFSGMLVLNATFASSAPSGIVPQMMEQFGFGREVATLTIALFVAGYCVGPLIWGPLSEQYGRKLPSLVAFVVYTCFQVGCALSPNTGAILTFRFISGTFAAAPLVISGAVISDLWDANTRGKALGFFTLAPFAGPSLGPTVSGFMAVAGVSWRPILLVERAKKMRKETGDDRWWAPFERTEISLKKRVENIVARPFKIFFREPMLIAITFYMSFIYGCIYLLFEAYPIVFTQGHNFNAGISGLTFLPIFIGACLGVASYLVWWNPKYERLAREFAPLPVPPEYRLEQAMYAAPIFALSFFWFGWTSYPSVSFWAPMMAGGPLGFSIVWIFLALFNYIIDAYLFVAASALASSTVIRSLFGAGFPLFATQMFESLNPRWASTLLGCIALAMAPIPFILRTYGPVMRRKSKTGL